jgi:hypothetical protein
MRILCTGFYISCSSITQALGMLANLSTTFVSERLTDQQA